MNERAPRAVVRNRLARAGCVAADEEADELLAAAPDAAVLEAWLRRREAGEPLAWITGRVMFCDQRLQIDPGVFVPRQQSEELARRAASAVPDAGRLVDLCTGTGAIARAVAAAAPSAAIVATDLDARAARCAQHNGVRAIVADLDAGLEAHAFDVVTAITPYVPSGAMRLLPADVLRYEPRAALDGGVDGLDVLGRVVVAASRLLVPGGSLLVELGANQEEALLPMLHANGFDAAVCWHDEDGDVRGLSACLSE